MENIPTNFLIFLKREVHIHYLPISESTNVKKRINRCWQQVKSAYRYFSLKNPSVFILIVFQWNSLQTFENNYHVKHSRSYT